MLEVGGKSELFVEHGNNLQSKSVVAVKIKFKALNFNILEHVIFKTCDILIYNQKSKCLLKNKAH